MNDLQLQTENGDLKELSGILGSSLLADLRFKQGSDDNIEWLMLYEKHPFSPVTPPRLIYAKVNILTPLGRALVELNQAEIAQKCNIYSSNTGLFIRALTFAMSAWDNRQ